METGRNGGKPIMSGKSRRRDCIGGVGLSHYENGSYTTDLLEVVLILREGERKSAERGGKRLTEGGEGDQVVGRNRGSVKEGPPQMRC